MPDPTQELLNKKNSFIFRLCYIKLIFSQSANFTSTAPFRHCDMCSCINLYMGQSAAMSADYGAMERYERIYRDL